MTQEYSLFGHGRPLLIFPGTLEGIAANMDLVNLLSTARTVCVFDFYRFNSVNDFCDFVTKLIEKMGWESVDIYGHSLGAMLAMSFAKRHIKLVENLILSHGCLPDSPSFAISAVPAYRILRPFVSKIKDSQIVTMRQKLLSSIGSLTTSQGKILGINVSVNVLAQLEKMVNIHLKDEKLDKQALECAINLGLDYVYHEQIEPENYSGWKGKTLILRTDNDYFMNRDGGLEKIFPQAKIVTYQKTSHLTRHLRFAQMGQEIGEFLSVDLR